MEGERRLVQNRWFEVIGGETRERRVKRENGRIYKKKYSLSSPFSPFTRTPTHACVRVYVCVYAREW